MAFLTRAFPLRESTILYLPAHIARMRVVSCEDILFPLPQHVHEFPVVSKCKT